MLERLDGAVFCNAGGHGMIELMPCPAVHEDLLSIKVHLDRFAGLHGKKTCRQFQWIRRGFGAKSPAHIRLDNPDFSYWQAERHCHGALDIMRRLSRGIKGQSSEVIKIGKASLGFDKCRVLTFVYKRCCLYKVTFLECRFDIAEFLMDFSGDIAREFLMQKRSPFSHCLLDGEDSGEFFVIDFDQSEGFHGGFNIYRCYGRHIVAHMPDPVIAENSLVITSGTYAKLDQTCFF